LHHTFIQLSPYTTTHLIKAYLVRVHRWKGRWWCGTQVQFMEYLVMLK